jgi:hypothetical protein
LHLRPAPGPAPCQTPLGKESLRLRYPWRLIRLLRQGDHPSLGSCALRPGWQSFSN